MRWRTKTKMDSWRLYVLFTLEAPRLTTISILVTIECFYNRINSRFTSKEIPCWCQVIYVARYRRHMLMLSLMLHVTGDTRRCCHLCCMLQAIHFDVMSIMWHVTSDTFWCYVTCVSCYMRHILMLCHLCCTLQATHFDVVTYVACYKRHILMLSLMLHVTSDTFWCYVTYVTW